jgi:hypothetical protein
MSDAVLFDKAKKAIKAKNEIAITQYDTGRWQGLPAMWMDGRYRQNNLMMKSLRQ